MTTDFPAISAIHHVSITVVDLDRSIDWYRRALGFEVAARQQRDGADKVMIAHPGGLTISLISHGSRAAPDGFSEFRPGLDHLAFEVADLDELENWRSLLDNAGVEHHGIVAGMIGHLIDFRDPDGIALEFYTRRPTATWDSKQLDPNQLD